MKKLGNAEPQTCVDNLIKLKEGECPMNRAMGLDGTLIDSPADPSEIEEDIMTTIDTYDERVSVNAVDFDIDSDGDSTVEIDMDISYSEESENEPDE